MEEEEDAAQPLLPTTATTTPSAAAIASAPTSSSNDQTAIDDNDIITASSSSDKGIFARLFFIGLIAAISVWANLEASRGFRITVINDPGNDTFAGRRFHLLFVSNDEATRLILRASDFSQDVLFSAPDPAHKRERVNHVILRLSRRNMTRKVSVEPVGEHGFRIDLCPSLMGEEKLPDLRRAVAAAVQQGVTEMWLWGSRNHTWPSLTAGTGASAKHHRSIS